jgi:putative ABC transport system substrate-binding protein
VLWHAGSAEEEDVYLSVLVKAFHDLGYDEGKNIHFDHRFPAENPERFQILARELVDAKPDVIIAVTEFAALKLKKATSTIPIVVTLSLDPIGTRLVEKLARPGGNVTGLSLMAIDLSGKRLELLKEAVPSLSRVALLKPPLRSARSRCIKLRPRHWEFPCGQSRYRTRTTSSQRLTKSPRTAPMASCVAPDRGCSIGGRKFGPQPSNIACQ